MGARMKMVPSEDFQQSLQKIVLVEESTTSLQQLGLVYRQLNDLLEILLSPSQRGPYRRHRAEIRRRLREAKTLNARALRERSPERLDFVESFLADCRAFVRTLCCFLQEGRTAPAPEPRPTNVLNFRLKKGIPIPREDLLPL